MSRIKKDKVELHLRQLEFFFLRISREFEKYMGQLQCYVKPINVYPLSVSAIDEIIVNVNVLVIYYK